MFLCPILLGRPENRPNTKRRRVGYDLWLVLGGGPVVFRPNHLPKRIGHRRHLDPNFIYPSCMVAGERSLTYL